MENAAQQEPNTHALTLRHACWDEVHENLHAVCLSRRHTAMAAIERTGQDDLSAMSGAILKSS
jgi:hypothetical protein